MITSESTLPDAELGEGKHGDDEAMTSSSDSEGGDVMKDISESDANMIVELEGLLEGNPNLYDAHVQLIEVLRRCKRLREPLREARHAMHARFPLTEAMWFDWVSDELEAVEGAQDFPRIAALFEEAVKDYLSIGLWCQYIVFVRDFDAEVAARSPEGVQRMRDLCEAALTACGLHVTEGGMVWALYRGFESTIEQESRNEEAAGRVRALFHRQLAVPLADGAETLAAYEHWEQARRSPAAAGQQESRQADAVPRQVRRSYELARRAYELRRPYEAGVGQAGAAPDADLLAAFMAYIKVEESGSEPVRVALLYERALAVFPVTHYLWLSYGRYTEGQLRDPGAVGSVYARAARNCPWVGEVWARRLRALERTGAEEEAQVALYAEALGSGLAGAEDYVAVALARADALRRRGPQALPQLHGVFSAADAVLASFHPDSFDPGLRLTAYWAECELKMGSARGDSGGGGAVGGGIKGARAVWEAALKSPAGRHAEPWLAYAQMERRAGHLAEARAVFKRCYARKLEAGGQAAVCEAWLRFEREEGSAEDHLAACIKAEPMLAEAAAAALAAADTQAAEAARAAAEKAPKAPPTREDAKKLRQQADPNFKRRQREAGVDDKSAPPPRPKRPRTAEPAAAPQPKQQQAAEAAAAPPAPDAPMQSPQPRQHRQQEGEGEGEERQGAPRKPGDRQAECQALTAFVKNLGEDVDEAAVRGLFGECGEIRRVKLSMNPATGRPKGFGYVEFTSREDLRKACALNDAEFRGRTLFVAQAAPPGAAGGGSRGGAERGGGRIGGGRGGRDFDQGGRGRGPRGILDLAGSETASKAEPPRVAAFVPRAAAIQKGRGGRGGAGALPGGGGASVQSNAEFRKLMLNGGGA